VKITNHIEEKTKYHFLDYLKSKLRNKQGIHNSVQIMFKFLSKSVFKVFKFGLTVRVFKIPIELAGSEI
jgi:hypothetical protein